MFSSNQGRILGTSGGLAPPPVTKGAEKKKKKERKGKEKEEKALQKAFKHKQGRPGEGSREENFMSANFTAGGAGVRAPTLLQGTKINDLLTPRFATSWIRPCKST